MTKYSNSFERIKQFIKADERDTPDYATKDFDLHKLNGSWFQQKKAAFQGWFLNHILLWIMQASPLVSWIVAKITGIYFVTRYDDVITVLDNPKTFNVPFGLDMLTMTTEPVFALGDDGEIHKDQMSRIYPAWLGQELGDSQCPRRKYVTGQHIDLDSEIREPVGRYTRARLRDAGGKIDAASGIFMPVCAQSAFDVFGIEPSNPDDFAAYLAACSALIFADINGSRVYWEQAMIGAKAISAILDQNIQVYATMPQADRDAIADKKFLHKMMDSVALDQGGPVQSWDKAGKDKVRSMLFGVLTGYVPTAALGAGKMLDYMRKHPHVFNEARALARKIEAAEGTKKEEARAAFQTFLLEVGRFNPSLSPGQLRVRNATHDGAGLPAHLQSIPKGATLLVCSAAAVRDRRKMKHPHRFNPQEGYQDKTGQPVADITFGHGKHWCFGEYSAQALLTTMFQALLSQPELAFEREKPLFFGPYPGRIRMRFDVETGHRAQQMLNATIPLAPNADLSALCAVLAEMQSTQIALKKALQKTEIVHFCSLNLVKLDDSDDPDAPPTHLLVELNVDGSQSSSLARIESFAGAKLDRLCPYLNNPEDRSFVALARENMLELQSWPWGTTGLAFPGTEDLSVAQILAERAFFDVVREHVEKTVDEARMSGQPAYSKSPANSAEQRSNYLDPSQLLKSVRQKFSDSNEYGWLLHRPEERAPGFARHSPVSYNAAIFKFLETYKTHATIAIGLTILLPFILLLIYCATLWHATGLYVRLWMVPLLLGVTGLILFLAMLRTKEAEEIPDERFAPHSHLAAVQETEDLPGHMQNHITSVSEMKRGLFRRITFALALFIIKQMKIFWFRPGFVTDFATIHYARWFRPKGTNKLIFQAHYDGSWESYLEDFVTKAHQGQTIAWNNAEGFPKTTWFSERGAEDGDAFKRWVRRQQIVPQFWFSAYPDLTTGMIRTNAQVRDGLARATTYEEARAWLSLFSSTHRPQTALETEEIQTLLFHGLGHHLHMQAFVIRFTDADAGKQWLSKLVNESFNTEERGTPEPQTLAFGDSYPKMDPSFIGFTATGLKYLGFPEAPHYGIASMPHAFAQGMSQRGRILGDAKTTDWRWADQIDGKADAHAIWLCYARNESKTLTKAEIDVLTQEGGFEIIDHIHCKLERNKQRSDDAFGIKDGISQPVMSGTQAFARRSNDHDDIVGPGEFILGYPDSRAEMPLTITVPGWNQAASLLPSTQPLIEEQIANFGRQRLGVARDFGRNGSFLAVRHMLHNRKGFKDFVEHHANGMSKDTPAGATSLASLTSEPQIQRQFPARSWPYEPQTDIGTKAWAKQWVVAKMIGRWPDGSSLARNPALSLTVSNRSRYYSRIRHRLKQARKDPSLEAAIRTKITEFLDKMGELGADVHESLTYHPDLLIWEHSEWKTFIANFKKLEDQLNVPLDLPRHLLKPIVPDNDFRHGRDDPKGLYCPIGSHIRRANPRDSFKPNSQTALEINKRHRLLRRGRTYVKNWDNSNSDAIANNWLEPSGGSGPLNEEGTLFMCFNANLERQFEFVQQTWLNSRVFHDARNMPDPLITPKEKGDRFSIPRSSNAVILDMHPDAPGEAPNGPQNFVKTVAGGYFFFPGRQAIKYLSQLTGT